MLANFVGFHVAYFSGRLLGYLPYHGIRSGVIYPAALLLTARNDDRVPPLQSCKFAVRLQEKAGHYGDNRFNGEIRRKADMYACLLEILEPEPDSR